MATQVQKITYQLRRGSQAVFESKNPILAAGEPVVVWCNDGIVRLKIGDGETPYNKLNYIGEDNVVNAKTHFNFPNKGKENVIYKAEDEALIYQWNTTKLKYEIIGSIDSPMTEIDIISGGEALDLLLQ